jgi:CRISPR-associated protein Csb2
MFHGQGDGGLREWPPSPLRVFQALVAAAARRNAGELSSSARSALTWLEAQPEAPVVIAPVAVEGNGYRLSVPNNAMDIVSKAWARGNESNTGDANPATHRTMKPVRPVLLAENAICYLWRLPDPVEDHIRGHLRVLSNIAGGIAALGWGLDLAIGHGAVISDGEAEQLPGERWLPGDVAAEGNLRIPVQGTLEDVIRHYEHLLKRVGAKGFVPPPSLSTYRRVEYRRAIDPPPRKFAAFSLLRVDASGFRPFDAARRGLTVAGMMRGVMRAAAEKSGWPEAKVASFVLGHAERQNDERHVAVGPRRFAYLPLPTIESRSGRPAAAAGSLRRILATTFAEGCEDEIAWARRAISGQELRDEETRQPAAVLSLIPENDRVVRRYTQPAVIWATVTPVILPGYDDPKHYWRRMQRGVGADEQREMLVHLDRRIDGLLRKAILQAGFPKLLADDAEIEWRKAGFWAGTELADRYGAPDHLKRFPRYHVKIQWRARGSGVKIGGPICLGGGRFYGLGLFAAV